MLTTHYMEEAQALADRVAVISGGQIVAEETPATIGGRDTALARISFALAARVRSPTCPSMPCPPAAWSPRRPRSRPGPLHLLTSWALRHGTVLDQLTVDRPSLEDIYLRLTGHDEPEHTTERNPR